MFMGIASTNSMRKKNGLERMMSTDSYDLPQKPPTEKKEKQSFLKLRRSNKRSKNENRLGSFSCGSGAGSSPTPRKVYVDVHTLNPVGGHSGVPVGGASVGGASVGGASVGGASVGGASVGGATISSFSSADVKYYWTDTDDGEPAVPIIPTWMHEHEVSAML